MKSKKRTWLAAACALCLVFAASYAAAGSDNPGPGFGPGPMGGCRMAGPPEQGMGMGMGMGPGCFMRNLSKEQREKMDAEVQAFENATEDLRRGIYQKGLDLEKELANKKPSLKNALAIQKEISALEADLDLKWIEHRIKMQEICPFMGKGHGPRGKGCPRTARGGPLR